MDPQPPLSPQVPEAAQSWRRVPRNGHHPVNESQRWCKFPPNGFREKHTDNWTQLGSQPPINRWGVYDQVWKHPLAILLTWQALDIPGYTQPGQHQLLLLEVKTTYIPSPTDKPVPPLPPPFTHFHMHACVHACLHVHRGMHICRRQRWMLGIISHHSSTLLRQDLSIKPRDHRHGWSCSS